MLSAFPVSSSIYVYMYVRMGGSINQTPPHGLDVTQGQFLSGFNMFEFFLLLGWEINQV